MNEVPTILEIIGELVPGHTNADQLADDALIKAGLPDELRPVFFSLVRWAAQRQLRNAARSNAPVWTKPATAKTIVAVAPSSLVRPSWMRERFSLPDGRMVTWADATVADHEDRIAMQLKLAGGIKRDIDNHKEAIRRCKAGGVERLADLPEYGGVAA